MTSITLHSVAQSTTLPHNPYIYALCLRVGALFSIASDDVLRCFDPATLQLVYEIEEAHKGITCLNGWDLHDEGPQRWSDKGKSGLIVTSGRDGMVRMWDPKERSTKPAFEMGTARNTPLSALACNAAQNIIAAGAEIEVSGREAEIYLWDIRHSTSPLHTYTESHTDTITTLSFLPSGSLLSGSTDGLLTLFDTAHANEDDAVLQVFNHGSAVHRAAYVGGWICATSSDEMMAFYEVGGSGEPEEEGGKGVQVLGDVRELVGCRYVVEVAVGGEDVSRLGSLVVGDSTRNHLATYPLQHVDNIWSIQKEYRTVFEGAHGGEVVRDLFFDSRQASTGTFYTCGEDGLIKAWKRERTIQAAQMPVVADEMDVDMEEAETSKPKRRKK